MRSDKVDMLHGPLAVKLILFAIPLALSAILQQLFNSVDVAIIGRYAGSSAQAAVGANVVYTGIFVNFLMGLSVGPNVLIAQRIGEGRREKLSPAVHTSVAMALLFGTVFMLIGQLIAHPLMILTECPPSVLDQAEIYFRVYLLGLPFMTAYDFGAACLRSNGDSKSPLICLTVSGVLNVLLNVLFTAALRWGVVGVGLATVLSNFVSAALVFSIMGKSPEDLRLRLRKIRIHKEPALQILRIGLPSGVQSGVVTTANVVIQSAINTFGEAAIAGCSISLIFEYITWDIANAFAHAATTFSGQNYGAGQLKRCHRIFWLTLAEGYIFTQILCVILALFSMPILRFFTSDAAVLDFANQRMWMVMILESVTAFSEIGCAMLRSLGKSVTPSVLTVIGSVFFRIGWVQFIWRPAPSFPKLMMVYFFSWAFSGILTLIFYFLHYNRLTRSAQTQTAGA